MVRCRRGWAGDKKSSDAIELLVAKNEGVVVAGWDRGKKGWSRRHEADARKKCVCRRRGDGRAEKSWALSSRMGARKKVGRCRRGWAGDKKSSDAIELLVAKNEGVAVAGGRAEKRRTLTTRAGARKKSSGAIGLIVVKKERRRRRGWEPLPQYGRRPQWAGAAAAPIFKPSPRRPAIPSTAPLTGGLK